MLLLSFSISHQIRNIDKMMLLDIKIFDSFQYSYPLQNYDVQKIVLAIGSNLPDPSLVILSGKHHRAGFIILFLYLLLLGSISLPDLEIDNF